MKYTVKEVKEIVREMLGDNADGVYICNEVASRDIGPDEAYIYTNLKENFAVQTTNSCRVANGLTRLVLIPNDKDYVIKIPFTKIYGINEDEIDEEKNLILYEAGKVLIDYCDEEMVNLDNNIDADFLSFFAKIEFVGYYNHIPIYVQEKVKFLSYEARKIPTAFCDFSLKRKELDYIDCYDIPTSFITAVLNVIGLKKALSFFEMVENDIEDIHDGNLGFNSKGFPIIFDYAGYSGYNSWEFYK